MAPVHSTPAVGYHFQLVPGDFGVRRTYVQIIHDAELDDDLLKFNPSLAKPFEQPYTMFQWTRDGPGVTTNMTYKARNKNI